MLKKKSCHLKKTGLLLIFAGVVLVLSVVLLSGRNTTTNSRREVAFAVPDTSSIQSVFLADRSGSKVLLERISEGCWKLDGKETAMKENVDGMLSVIRQMTVKMPVGKAAVGNVMKWLASGATKVQVTYFGHRIAVGRFHIWKCLKNKTFYMGSPTPDNLGNYAVMEGSKQPYIVYVPGFRGFISPYFSAVSSDWKSHELLNLRISEIAEVKLLDLENPAASLIVKRHGDKHFDIISLDDGKVLPLYDTLKLYDHLSSYRKLNYEFIADGLTPAGRDSILSAKFMELTVTDVRGVKLEMSLYRMWNEFNTEEYEYLPEFMDLYNRDKFYVSVNGNEQELFICQYFVFDRIIQPLGYYLVGDDRLAIPK